MKAERRKMDRHEIFRGRGILPKLLDIKRPSKHPESYSRRGRRQLSGSIEAPVEVDKKGMSRPAGHIRETRIGIERGHGTFGGAKMPLACVHVLIGIIRERKDGRSPGKRMAAPEARGRRCIGWRLAACEDVAHGLGCKAVSNLGRLDIAQDFRIVGRSICGLGHVLLHGKLQGKDDRGFGELLLRGHFFNKVYSV
jgi:hypothetical protein